jgi:thioredoxin-like negative regulator of GroEL
LYERALLLDPSSTAESRAEAAGALSLEAGRPAMAARILGRALDSPQNTELWIRALAQSGGRDQALSFLAESRSDQVEAEVWRAEWLVELGDAKRALNVLQAMSGSPRVELIRGEALTVRGEDANAAAVLAGIPFGASTFEASRLALVECSTTLGRAGASMEALSRSPHGSLSVRTKLAEFYLDEGELRAALRLFDPKHPKERALVARLFEEAGDFPEAAAYYASLSPSFTDGSPLAARASAERLVAHGHLEEAVSVLELWRAAAPDDLYARVRLVELLLAQNRGSDASREGHEALGVIEDQVLWAHLSDLLALQSNVSR